MNLKFCCCFNTFKAKPGQTDDLVMSPMVIAIRMVEYVSSFEDDVYNVVNSSLSIVPEKMTRAIHPICNWYSDK